MDGESSKRGLCSAYIVMFNEVVGLNTLGVRAVDVWSISLENVEGIDCARAPAKSLLASRGHVQGTGIASATCPRFLPA